MAASKPEVSVEGEADIADDTGDIATAVTDPSGYYDNPEMILADGVLSRAQKQRFLADWAQDLADRDGGEQAGQAETAATGGADAAELAETVAKARERLADPDFTGDCPDRTAGQRTVRS